MRSERVLLSCTLTFMCTIYVLYIPKAKQISFVVASQNRIYFLYYDYCFSVALLLLMCFVAVEFQLWSLALFLWFNYFNRAIFKQMWRCTRENDGNINYAFKCTSHLIREMRNNLTRYLFIWMWRNRMATTMAMTMMMKMMGTIKPRAKCTTAKTKRHRTNIKSLENATQTHTERQKQKIIMYAHDAHTKLLFTKLSMWTPISLKYKWGREKEAGRSNALSKNEE